MQALQIGALLALVAAVVNFGWTIAYPHRDEPVKLAVIAAGSLLLGALVLWVLNRQARRPNGRR